MIDDAKEKARALGGDAILIGNWGSHLESVGSYGETYHGKSLALWVLRYPDSRTAGRTLDQGYKAGK